MTTAVTNNGIVLNVGDSITSTPQLMACPVGTVFMGRVNNGGESQSRYMVAPGPRLQATVDEHGDPIANGRDHPLESTRTDGFLRILEFPAQEREEQESTRLQRRADYDAVPAGGVIFRRAEPGERWHRTEEDADSERAWVYIPDPALTCSTRGFSPYRAYDLEGVRRVSTAIGDYLADQAAFDELPVGSVIRSPAPYDWVVEEDRSIRRTSDGSRRAPNTLNHHRYRLVSVPERTTRGTINLGGEVTGGEGTKIALLPETVRQYQQRFFTTAWGNALHAGVGTDYHTQVMRDLGADREVYEAACLGAAYYGMDHDLLQRLPRGTVVQTGDPQVPEFHVIGKKINRRIDRVMGDWRGRIIGNHSLWYIISGEGLARPEWVDEVATYESHQEMIRWRAQAQERGERLRSQRSWCGEYNRAVGRADVWTTHHGHRIPTAEEYLTAQQVSDLPEGSVLFYETRGQHCWLVRDNRMTNPARTRSLGGSIAGDWADFNMVQVGPRPDQMRHQIGNGLAVEHLPVGSAINYSGSVYTMAQDRMFTHNGGHRYHPRDLTQPGVTTIVSIPVS